MLETCNRRTEHADNYLHKMPAQLKGLKQLAQPLLVHICGRQPSFLKIIWGTFPFFILP